MNVVTGRIVVELDDLASAMLREVCQNGDQCQHAGEDPRDLVNAAVTFYFSNGERCHHKFDLSDGTDALKRATADRRRLERRTQR